MPLKKTNKEKKKTFYVVFGSCPIRLCWCWIFISEAAVMRWLIGQKMVLIGADLNTATATYCCKSVPNQESNPSQGHYPQSISVILSGNRSWQFSLVRLSYIQRSSVLTASPGVIDFGLGVCLDDLGSRLKRWLHTSIVRFRQMLFSLLVI